MEEQTVEQPTKTHRGWPKGKARGPRTVAAPAFTAAPEPEAPIHIRLRLKNYAEPVEFGCARRTVENGFHVFFYPSERDRYRETRREFAIQEIIEIEITEARRQQEIPIPPQYQFAPSEPTPVPAQRGPIIHAAPKPQGGIEALATSRGPIKMDTMPNLTFGDSAG